MKADGKKKLKAMETENLRRQENVDAQLKDEEKSNTDIRQPYKRIKEEPNETPDEGLQADYKLVNPDAKKFSDRWKKAD